MHVKINCESDQNLLGVERIMHVEIELPDGKCNDELSMEVFNKLAEKEYFTEDDDWKKEVEQDVAEIIKCKITDIEFV